MTRGTPSHAEFYRVYCTALVDHAKHEETSPEEAQLLYRRAETRLSEAFAMLKSSIDNDSQMFLQRVAQLQRALGDCKFGQEQYEKAHAEYFRGIEYLSKLDPPDRFWTAEFYFRCAWSNEMMERYSEARDELIEAIALVDYALENGPMPQGKSEFERARDSLVDQLHLMNWHIVRPYLINAWPVVARPIQQIPFLRVLVPAIGDQKIARNDN
ncbi:MAG: tetratricopeptide repeat protein [Pirellulaceae bacterium]